MITHDLRKKIRIIGIAYIACPCLGTLLCAVLSRNLHVPRILSKEINNNKKHQMCLMFELIISIFALLNKATLSPSYVIIFFQYLIHFHSSKPQQKSSPFPPFRLRFLFFPKCSRISSSEPYAWPKGAKKTRQRR